MEMRALCRMIPSFPQPVRTSVGQPVTYQLSVDRHTNLLPEEMNQAVHFSATPGFSLFLRIKQTRN
jgi:hypothetical protein